MRLVFLIALAGLSVRGEILDRIAIIVDRTVITETQLDEELRVTAFLNREPLKRDVESRRAAGDRLVEQALVQREIAVTSYPPPAASEIARLYAQTRQEYGGDSAMTAALEKYQLNDSVLKQHLSLQLAVLNFVDVRFRPDVEISEKDISEYYQRKLDSWRKAHRGTPPTLDESRAAIEKSLTDERSEYALSSWLKETRKEANIIYLDKELEQP